MSFVMRALQEKALVDWTAIIMQLERKGWAAERIANGIGVARTTVLGWKNPPYAAPKHHDGEALIALWCRELGKPRDDLPLKSGI